MLVIGLTGGIGSGKSTVAALLVERGAVHVDTDAIARLVVQPGEPANEAVANRFGEELIDAAGNIDRSALGAIVFNDEIARADLEAIVHPAIKQVVDAHLAEQADTDNIVILDVPLLIYPDGTSRYECDGIVVVDTSTEIAIERLTTQRNMSEEDAQARIAAQIPRATRLRAADFVILNVGTLAELAEMTAGAWRWIEGRRQSLKDDE